MSRRFLVALPLLAVGVLIVGILWMRALPDGEEPAALPAEEKTVGRDQDTEPVPDDTAVTPKAVGSPEKPPEAPVWFPDTPLGALVADLHRDHRPSCSFRRKSRVCEHMRRLKEHLEGSVEDLPSFAEIIRACRHEKDMVYALLNTLAYVDRAEAVPIAIGLLDGDLPSGLRTHLLHELVVYRPLELAGLTGLDVVDGKVVRGKPVDPEVIDWIFRAMMADEPLPVSIYPILNSMSQWPRDKTRMLLAAVNETTDEKRLLRFIPAFRAMKKWPEVYQSMAHLYDTHPSRR